MDGETDSQCSSKTESDQTEEFNQRSENVSKQKKRKKEKKHKTHKKTKKHKKSKRDEKERTHRAVRKYDGESSGSENEVCGRIDDLFTNVPVCSTCVYDDNGEKKHECYRCKTSTDMISDDDDTNQRPDSFQQMDSFNNNNERYGGDNPPPASTSSSLTAEPERFILRQLNTASNITMPQFNESSSSTVEPKNSTFTQQNTITMLEFSGPIKKSVETAGTVSDDDRLHVVKPVSEPMLDVDSNPEINECRQVGRMLTQSKTEFNYRMPEFSESVKKSLNTGSVSNDDRIHIVRILAEPMLHGNNNPRTTECRHVVMMLKTKYPNAFKNKESSFCVENITRNLMRHVNYLKSKKQNKPKLGGLCQNNQAFSKMSNKTKMKFGICSERFAPQIQNMKNNQDVLQINLKCLYDISKYITLDVGWDYCKRFMKLTYVGQRYTIQNENTIKKIFLDWPFLGKGMIMKIHFNYLTNTEETAISNFKEKIPSMLKFIKAEAEMKPENNDLQIQLTTIMKNYNSKKQKYNEFLTVLLCFMTIMKQNIELMFIVFNDTIPFNEILSSSRIISTPVVVCLGDIWSNPKCFVFVDKHCLWHYPMRIQGAIQTMFMSYYLFNLKYPEQIADILQFLQSYMFNITDENNEIEKCTPKLSTLMKNYENYVKEEPF